MSSEKNCRQGVWHFAQEMVLPKSMRVPGGAGLRMAQSSPRTQGDLLAVGTSAEAALHHRRGFAAQIKSFNVRMWQLFPLPHSHTALSHLLNSSWALGAGLPPTRADPLSGGKCLWIKFLRCCRNPTMSLTARSSPVSPVRCSLLGTDLRLLK